MKKLQNCLYINRQGTYLHKERETIVIKQDNQKILQIPIHSISDIYCFGNVLVSPAFMGFCGQNNVNLAFFSEYGNFYGRLQGIRSGNVFLRRAQYHINEDKKAEIVKNIIAAKIKSSKGVLSRYNRNYEEDENITKSIQKMNFTLSHIKNVNSIEKLRGYEGEAASYYFSNFQTLIKKELHNDFRFNGRTRRPPRDPVNALLSFIYSIMYQNISSALQGVGLDPQIGFLHSDRPGRDSLALDILEEFRAWLCDRLVLTMINRKQVSIKQFTTEASHAIKINEDLRKEILANFQIKKQEIIKHPYLGENVEIGLLPHIQAMLLSRFLRGDIENYPPFYIQ